MAGHRLTPRSVIACLAELLALAACAGRFTPPALAPLPFSADTARSRVVSDGVVLRYIHSPEGPWGIHVLDVDLDRCVAMVAMKGANGAAGRTRTTALLARLSARERVLGGANGDFFSLATGTPLGLLVVDGVMLTPPGNHPALAFDSSGAPHIATFTWSHDTLAPFHPIEAVGGRPVLVRDSAITSAVDTTGAHGFSVGRNPRTAAGVAGRGRRLLLVVIDGRQMPYSDGMSLRETARLLLALGARDAINLDGGGSSTLVYADPDAHGRITIANRPSDKQGERAVGDALAVVRRCHE